MDSNTQDIPVRKILTKDDLDNFLSSPIFNDLVSFIQKLSDAVAGIETTNTDPQSPIIQKLSNLLQEIKQAAIDTKPVLTNNRFGNPAFKDFYDKVALLSKSYLSPFVSENHDSEICKYLSESFGSRKRIDYGTGHELNFIAFLLCLDKLSLFQPTDYKNLVLLVFYKYVDCMRFLQYTYWLEPAGSHGVWGLDDYHFLPFYFGASQLSTHKHLSPKSIHNSEILSEFKSKYMYFDMVHFVTNLKTGSLRWHSPMLDDISGAKTWLKVNSGLLKMYMAEVLSKLPIMQHFYFGHLLQFNGGSLSNSDAALLDSDLGQDCKDGHVYALGQEFPVCCGIRIPSAFAPLKSSPSSRIMPFD
ncbi:Serine/threonine-protein phosphatase 2A activator 2 [Smittium culicis]|uniref:Serine/threonine-protein phosphatase 2A activator n=2 Tax=Smittium culicis TaxID=133412 RepID=A0A1R1WZY4_9FUNG|nr:Serine/threonine-protein phosphatase 2A activator 2 [Smittium culicis]